MVSDVDEALCTMLGAALADRAAVSIDPPPTEPASKPRVHAFLVAIREDLSALGSDWEELRDASGITIGRRAPVRSFELHYVVTAHARDTATEHALLDTVIEAVTSDIRIESAHLPRGLADLGLPVAIHLAEPADDPHTRRDQRTRLGVVVTAPLVPPTRFVSPPPERFHLGARNDHHQAPAPRPVPKPLRERKVDETKGS
jgi:hypothetical protein